MASSFVKFSSSGFVPSVIAPLRFATARQRQTCITCSPQRISLRMKTQGSRKSRANSSSRTRDSGKSIASGTKDDSQVENRNGLASGGVGFGNQHPEQESAVKNDEIVESEATGSAGDATPHRAFRPSGRESLQDPLKSVEDESDESEDDLPESPKLDYDIRSVEKDRSLLWSWDISADKVVENLAVAMNANNLAKEIVTNRHFITERVLYRFTSALLQAESQGATEEALNMRRLRAEIMKICWYYDEPLRNKLFDAEERVVSVIRAPPESNTVGEIDRVCGNDTTTVNAFWIVLYASVAAWEAKQSAENEQPNPDVEEKLSRIAGASQQSQKIKKYLSSCLRAVGMVLASSTPEEQEEALSSLDEEAVADMCIIQEQIRLWPPHAYGPFLKKLQPIVDFAVQKFRTIPVEKLETFDFEPPKLQRMSKIISFKSRNQNGLKI